MRGRAGVPRARTASSGRGPGTVRSSRASSSKAALSPAQASPASLALERLAGGGTGSVAATSAARAVRVERSGTIPPRRAILRGVDRELAPVDLTVVEEPDRLGGLGLVAKLDEGEPPRASGLAVRGQVYLDDAACLGQELRQGVGRGAKVQVSDEDSGWNGLSPPGRSGWLAAAVLSGPDGLSNPRAAPPASPRPSGSPRRTCPRAGGRAARSSRRTGTPTGRTGRSSRWGA